MKRDSVEKIIRNSITVKESILSNKDILNKIVEIAEAIAKAYKNDNKVLFCGNGGSAADAQHLASELSGKFYIDREPLYAEALHVNTSYLTATANDYSFEEVYSRLVRAKGNQGDFLIGLSTSGNSKNVVKALAEAQNKNMITVGLTGTTGGEMDTYCDYLIKAPSSDTPRIQEAHILIGHIICELVEKELFEL